MKIHFNNQILNSFALYVDHQVTKKGEAFLNYSSSFSKVDDLYTGFYTYAAPTKQILFDTSITGATQLSGIFVTGVYRNIGEENLVAINHDKGHLYFTASQGSSSITGAYAVKEINTYLTEDSEQKIVFDTKYEVRPKAPQTFKGVEDNTVFAPAIFIKTNSVTSEPFCLGGTDKIIYDLRAIVISKSVFSLDATCGILQDMSRTYFGVVNPPFGALGYTGIPYNYDSLNTVQDAFIDNITVSKVSKDRGNSEYNTLNSDIYAAFVDFEICVFKNPRA